MTPATTLSFLAPGADLGQVDDWDPLLATARNHRLLPLLHQRLGQAPAPDAVRAELTQAHKASTLAALIFQRSLILVHQQLEQAGIAHLFLKGAFLATQAYPQPGLRPMRDLDVLVRPDQAEAAFDLLLAKGARLRKGAHRVLGPAIETRKHLPGLLLETNVPVELHVRLAEPGVPLAEADWWDRSVTAPLAGHDLPFLAPEDLAVHLAIHSAHEHGFDNGPLILSDLGYLTQSKDLDWQAVWDRAAEVEATRPLALCLALTEAAWGPLGLQKPDSAPEITGEMLSIAQTLCLRAFKARGNANLVAELTEVTPAGKAGVLLGRAFPGRTALANRFGVPENDPRIWLYYPRLWGLLLTQRLPSLLERSQAEQSLNEGDRLRHLRGWLAAERG